MVRIALIGIEGLRPGVPLDQRVVLGAVALALIGIPTALVGWRLCASPQGTPEGSPQRAPKGQCLSS